MSANTVGDFTLGFDRTRSVLVPEPNAVGPAVEVGTAFTKLGPGSNVPLDRVQNRFRGGAAMRHSLGNHQFVYGAELTRLHFNGREASSNRGNWYFKNDFGRDAITNFLLGTPSRYSTGIGPMDRGFRNWEQQYYAGDTWKLRPDLTLNYGVRYQPVTVPDEVNGLTVIPGARRSQQFRATVRHRAPAARFLGHPSRELCARIRRVLRRYVPASPLEPAEFLKVEVTAPDLISR